MPLARDLLSAGTIRVDAESRLGDALPEIHKNRSTHAAVYERDRFSCVIPLHALLPGNPQRIFADLVASRALPVRPGSTSIDEIGRMIEGSSPDGVGITDEQGRFEGVVTKDALLGARLVESKAKAVEMDGRRGELERLVAERTDALRAAVVQLEREIAERKLVQARIEQTLREKETLIEELFHRTRNTLQMIMGLVALQAEANPESGALARAAARTTQRIQAIARVHQCLYQSGDLSRVSVRDCLHGISRELLQNATATGVAPEVHLDIEDQRFLIDTVVPLGLVFSELLANALQHAFPAGRAGNIRVSLKRQGAASSVLTFSDDGVGVPGNFDAWNQPALGLRLVQSIGVTQLGGKVEVSNIGGLSFRLEFPHPVAPARV